MVLIAASGRPDKTFGCRNGAAADANERGINAVRIGQIAIGEIAAGGSIAMKTSGYRWRGLAALALLLEWIKHAKQEKKPIFFHNLSSQLMSVAEVAGVKTLLLKSC